MLVRPTNTTESYNRREYHIPCNCLISESFVCCFVHTFHRAGFNFKALDPLWLASLGWHVKVQLFQLLTDALHMWEIGPTAIVLFRVPYSEENMNPPETTYSIAEADWHTQKNLTKKGKRKMLGLKPCDVGWFAVGRVLNQFQGLLIYPNHNKKVK